MQRIDVSLVDPKAQYDYLNEEIYQAIRKVIEEGGFILGTEREAFEREIANGVT